MTDDVAITAKLDKDGGTIAVSGRGGGKPKAESQKVGGKESEVSLRSKAYMEVLCLLGEGEIDNFGVPGDALRSVYLDETPIQNVDGTLNFKDFQLDWRFGTQTQSYIPMTDGGASFVTNVQLQVTTATPITQSVTNPATNAIKVRLMTPLLRKIDNKQNLVSTRIDFQIQLSSAGGAFVTVVTDSFNGYTTGAVERDYRIPVTGSGAWAVKVVRLTPDSTSTQKSNDLYFQSITRIIDKKFRYPNSALLKIRISAEQFKNFPRLAVNLRLIKCRVPHNYNPETRVYTGVFNGTLSAPVWTDNPAWIFYDLVTSTRYGAGKFITPALLDVFNLYTIGQYCDELVPDGYGGVEPRFTCNIYLQESGEAYKVLNAIASVFRGMIYAAQGTVFVSQDAPRLPVKIYGEANVIQEVDEQGNVTKPPFEYQGVDGQAIRTVAYVTYYNPNDFYRTAIEYVEDAEGIKRYGFNPTDVVAVGCTSRGQARRVGLWLLTTERLRSGSITFSVGSDGLLSRPGELFKVNDVLRGGKRRFGRVIDTSTTTLIKLDAPVQIVAGFTHSLTVIAVNGTALKSTVSNGAGTYSQLTVSPAFSEVPAVNTPWLLESGDIKAAFFTCAKVTETSPTTYDIVGIPYNGSIYGVVDQDLPFETEDTSGLPDPNKAPLAPSGLTIEESLTESTLGVRVNAVASWIESSSPFIRGYELEYCAVRDAGAWVRAAETASNSLLLPDLTPDLYNFRVRGVNSLGIRGDWSVTQTLELTGLNKLPSDVTGFVANVSGDVLHLQWDLHPDLDVRIGGYFLVKYSPNVSGVMWVEGADVVTVSGTGTNAVVPLAEGTYQIKAVDSSGRESFNARAAVVSGVQGAIKYNAVASIDESVTFPGTKVDTYIANGVLKIFASDLIDAIPGNWDSIAGNIDDYGQPGQVYAYGEYYFAGSVDLGQVMVCRVYGSLVATSINERDLWDLRPGNIDDYPGLVDGQEIANCYAVMEFRASVDGTVWTDYTPLSTTEVTGRYFQARLRMFSGSPNNNVYVSQVALYVDMPDRITSAALTTAGGATPVSFDKAFMAPPVVGVTLQNGISGDYVEITSITRTGFVVTTKTAAGNPTPRTIVYFAKGYGRAA